MAETPVSLRPDLAALVDRWPVCRLFAVSPGGTIVVVGAYCGIDMELLANLFPSAGRIIGFEPQEWAAQDAIQRLRPYRNTEIHTVGLGATEARDVPMGEWHTDAASFLNTGPAARTWGKGKVTKFDRAMKGVAVERIALLTMNIEGYEFSLLPYMRETGWLQNLDGLAVQWHPGLGGNHTDMDREIEILTGLDGFRLGFDERPTWTYHERIGGEG